MLLCHVVERRPARARTFLECAFACAMAGHRGSRGTRWTSGGFPSRSRQTTRTWFAIDRARFEYSGPTGIGTATLR